MSRDNLSRRLARLESAHGLEHLSDEALEELADADELTPLYRCLSDAELDRVAAAPDDAPLAALLPDRSHPRAWPEWEDWNDLTRAAACDAWGET